MIAPYCYYHDILYTLSSFSCNCYFDFAWGECLLKIILLPRKDSDKICYTLPLLDDPILWDFTRFLLYLFTIFLPRKDSDKVCHTLPSKPYFMEFQKAFFCCCRIDFILRSFYLLKIMIRSTTLYSSDPIRLFFLR